MEKFNNIDEVILYSANDALKNVEQELHGAEERLSELKIWGRPFIINEHINISFDVVIDKYVDLLNDRHIHCHFPHHIAIDKNIQSIFDEVNKINHKIVPLYDRMIDMVFLALQISYQRKFGSHYIGSGFKINDYLKNRDK